MKAEADRDDQVGAEQAGRNSADAATRAEADVATHPRTKAEVAGRNAHQALRRAEQWVASGKRWVVDIDLEKFFDRVNEDLLMSKLVGKIGDVRVLTLIRRYLEAGMMAGGLVQPRTEGTPQGGPLSPLLSNVLLTDLDRELERRGHTFCRYADDCNIYVASERAGVGLLQSLTAFLGERLKLTVNASKSAVARPWQRKFL